MCLQTQAQECFIPECQVEVIIYLLAPLFERHDQFKGVVSK